MVMTHSLSYKADHRHFLNQTLKHVHQRRWRRSQTSQARASSCWCGSSSAAVGLLAMQRSRTDMYTQYVAPAPWSARERHARAAHHLKAWPLRQLVHALQRRIVVSMPCQDVCCLTHARCPPLESLVIATARSCTTALDRGQHAVQHVKTVQFCCFTQRSGWIGRHRPPMYARAE